MAEASIDVVGIGNAIVDVLTRSTDGFLEQNELPKGIMTLIDGDRAEEIYGLMGPGVEISGGSAANTIAGVAQLGSRAGFIGKVRDDQLGQVFAHDIRAAGVQFNTPPADGGPSSGRCLIMVTPDAQRTMTAYLGAAHEISADDVDADLVAAAQVTYLEGYLWDPPGGKAAFRKAMAICEANDRKVSLTLSDPFCVDRHRDEFVDLVENQVDILFANEEEIISLFQVDNFEGAVAAVRQHCEISALTRSEKGSVIVTNNHVHEIAAEPIAKLVDTTGAGDLYAAGFLHGYAQGLDLALCGQFGAIAAAEIIGHVGARPEADLKTLTAHLIP